LDLSDSVRWNVRPSSLLSGKLSDPVRVVSVTHEQHCLWEQRAEQNRTKPIVMRFAGREGETDRQAIGVPTAWILLVRPPRERPISR
jgi:hypothetical protein